MIELTDKQRERLESGKAVDVTDSTSASEFVLMRKDVYDRVRNVLYDDSEWSHDELRLLLTRSSEANGWNEPGMEAYDRYDEELAKRCS